MSLETMTKLASTTVGAGGVSSVIFSNIPQSYTDLKIIISGRTSDGNTGTIANIKFNGSTTGYSSRYFHGRGDTTTGGTGSTSAGDIGRFPGVNSPVTNSLFSNTEIYVTNYSGNTYKPYSVDSSTEANQTIAYLIATSGLWSNSSAITSVEISSSAGTVSQYSTFTLYGIKNARQTAGNSIKATGGNIVFDGTYVYHVFNSSAAFVPTQPILADYMVIAGGGAGGPARSGGGGGGGLLSSIQATGGGGTLQPRISLIPGSYTVTIGAGGVADGGAVVSGNNSSIYGAGADITAIGGGGGGNSGFGGQATGAGKPGGSGGGGLQGPTAGGAPTANQGYRGGNGSASYLAGAGGGGAGAQGVDVTGPTNDGTNGGIGLLLTSISVPTGAGINGYFAGGGGGGYFSSAGLSGTAGTVGGLGGAGGGGNGSVGGAGFPGTANTGGGGGSGRGNSGGVGDTAGGNGGSGLVVIRYKG
jgi:hypothetical protein